MESTFRAKPILVGQPIVWLPTLQADRKKGRGVRTLLYPTSKPSSTFTLASLSWRPARYPSSSKRLRGAAETLFFVGAFLDRVGERGIRELA